MSNEVASPAIANMNYPKQIKQLIKAYEAQLAEFRQENSKLEELRSKHSEAEYNDMAALKIAAIAGEPDPGIQATQDTARAVEYQAIRTKAKVTEVNESSAQVNTAIRQNRLVVIELACEKLEQGSIEWNTALVKLQVDFAEAYEARHESINGMRTLIELNLTTPEISFGVDGMYRQGEGFKVPDSDSASTGLVTTLRGIYSRMGKLGEAPAELEAAPAN